MAFRCAITQIDRKFKFNKYPAVYYALRVKLPSTPNKKKKNLPSTC